MASKCKSCDIAVMTSDFINCAGICGGTYHTKCVGLSKSMYTAVTNCPNICWFCRDCNSERMDASSSISDMKDTIDRLSSSLSSDLMQFLDGIKLLMNNLFDTMSTINSVHNVIKTAGTHVQCDDINLDSSIAHRKCVDDANVKGTSVASSQPTKSIVVSNVGKEVSADYLTNFLADELNVEHSKIKLSILIPNGKTIDDMRFVQYKVTVPTSKYEHIIDPSTWPENVRVRDFVYKPRKSIGVNMQDFLNKSIATERAKL